MKKRNLLRCPKFRFSGLFVAFFSLISFAGIEVFAQCVTIAPFTEDFNNGSSVPSCWTETQTSGDGWRFGTPGGFTWNTSKCSGVPADHTGNGSGYAALDHSLTDIGVVLESPEIDISAILNPQLDFYYQMCGTGVSPLNFLHVEAYNGATWDSVATIQQGTAGWELFTFSVSSNVYNTNFVKIRFRAESGGSSSNDYFGDQAIDDISVIAGVTCPTPTTLIATSPTSTGATLSWIESGSATNWQLAYGPVGFTPGDTSSTFISASTTPYALAGLNSNTTYECYVRSVCNVGDTSSWLGATTFTTLCSFQLNGTYTIDSTIATSATNYASIDDLLVDLNACGVTGPVVINVSTNMAGLIGPWDIGEIQGASAINTITFNGNNVLVSKNASTDYFLRLDGAKHIIINGFNFVNQTPTVPMYGIHMKNASDSIVISNNTIDVGTDYTSSSSAGIVSSNVDNSATGKGNNANNITIEDNEIIGGYTGIRFNGTSSTVRCNDFVVSRNIIRDFYYYGIYVYYCESVEFDSNDVSRNVRSTGTYFYGTYINNSKYCKITNNKIHDPGSSTTYMYGVYASASTNSSGNRMEIVNNELYNFTFLYSGYGIYLTGTKSYINIYHNTIDIQPSGSGSKYGLYNTTTTSYLSVKNNIFSIQGSGSGGAFGLYYNTTSTTINSDYNNVFVNSGGANNYGRWSSNCSSLSDFQTASNKEANSKDVDPIFDNSQLSSLTPVSSLIDDMGTNLGVLTDINGVTRSATAPDIGATEFTGIPGDLGIDSLVLARVSNCDGSADSAIVKLSNVLADTCDFSVNPLTIIFNVTGPVNSMDSVVVSTGKLAGGFDSIFYVSTIDMTLAGDYSVSAYIKPNAFNALAANDSLFNTDMETVISVFTVSHDSIKITKPNHHILVEMKSLYLPVINAFFTERGQYSTGTTGKPSPLPSWFDGDDYVEITGTPGTSLEGFTYELWDGSSKRAEYTFGAGEGFGPNGTLILSTYSGTASPSDHFYVIPGTTFNAGSTSSTGSVLKDEAGNIVDAMAYNMTNFPAASGITDSDWLGAGVSGYLTYGIRLEGADMNGPTGWINSSSSNLQDPNTLNTNVTVPSPLVYTGINWDSMGTTVNTTPKYTVGPYLVDGIHDYIVSFTNTCGVFTDTVHVEVAYIKAEISDSTMITCNGLNNGTATATASGGDAPYTYLWDNGDTTAMADSLAIGIHVITITDTNNYTSVDSVLITEPTTLFATTSTTPSVCGVPSGSATVTTTGGTLPYSINWSNGNTTATISSLTGGSYSVTLTDANSCTLIDNITISDNGAPSLSLVMDSTIDCFGDSTGVVSAMASGGSAPYTYNWSSGGTSSTENGLAIGMYSVTLTDLAGCVTSSSVTMTQNDSIELIISNVANLLCNNDSSGSATVIVTGGVTPYSYSWSNGDITANAINLTAGNHLINVTDSLGCMQSSSVTITEPTTLVGSFNNKIDVSCNGGLNGAVSLLSSGGTLPYSTLWSNSDTGTTADSLSSGLITVSVTDANSCMWSDTISILEPKLLALSVNADSNNLCYGVNMGVASATVSGGTLPYDYAWSNNDSVMITRNLIAGTYSVTITDANNCVVVDSAAIQEPNTFTLSTSITQQVQCNGENSGSAMANVVGGVAPLSYNWSNGDTADTISSLTAGTYWVTVTDFTNCVLIDRVIIREPIMLTASASVVSNVLCNSGTTGSATVSTSGGVYPLKYSWGNGDSTILASGLPSGVLVVTVSDTNNCSTMDSVTILQPMPITTAVNVISTVWCNGDSTGSASVLASGGTLPMTYSWSNSDTGMSAHNLEAGMHYVTVTDSNNCMLTDSVLISQPLAMSSTVNVISNAFCNGDSTGSASVMVTGGTLPMSYSWSNSDTGMSAYNLEAGIHYVTMIDSNNCTLMDSVRISQPLAMSSTVNVISNVFCNGDSTGSASVMAAGGTSPMTFAWSNAATGMLVSNLDSGMHYITVTDSNNCTLMDSISISQPSAMSSTINMLSNVLCNGDSTGSASVMAMGGISPMTYVWSNAAIGMQVNNLYAGMHYVTVTDSNNCTSIDSVSISQPSAISSIMNLLSNVLCNGDSNGSVSVMANGGVSPLTYAWSNTTTGMSASSLAAGVYSVTISDSNNCQVSNMITVTEPTALSVTVSGMDISCFGMTDGSTMVSAIGGTTPYSYLWNTGVVSSTLSALSDGTYSVVVTDSVGCMDSGMVSIIEPTAVTVSLGSDITICDGDSADISTINGFVAYHWSTGDTSTMVSVYSSSLGAGTTIVSVEVTDSSGCMGTDSVNVMVSNPVLVSITGDTALCMYETGTLDAGSGFTSYLWSNSSTTQMVNVDSLDMTVGANAFEVFVTNALGCEGVDSFHIELHPEVIFTLPADTAIWKDSVLTITADSGFASYLWSTNATSQSIEVDMSGTYSCIVTDSVSGCEGNDEIVIDFNVGLGDIEIAELKLYPNPASDYVNIEFNNFKGQGIVSLKIMSITGQLVKTIQVDVSLSNGSQTIDVSNLATGTYIIALQYENEHIVKQFTIR